MDENMSFDQYKKHPRLYLEGAALAAGMTVTLNAAQAHYLRNVMRLGAGDSVRVFNGQDGEWLAAVSGASKSGAALSCTKNFAPQKPSPDIWALASPVKKESFEFMFEKASELGASKFHPVLCQHTVVHRLNETRARAIAIEAAEQCERLDVMEIAELAELKNVLKAWDTKRKLVFCLEREGAAPIAEALQKIPRGTPLAVLVGPEGGFSPEEAAFISALPFAVPVSLGPRILRAETALIAALACVQAWGGDWR